MRRSLARGEKCILVCDKTLTGGTVTVQDRRAAPSKRLCRAQLDTKIFSFWTSDFYRGKGLAAPAFAGTAEKKCVVVDYYLTTIAETHNQICARSSVG